MFPSSGILLDDCFRFRSSVTPQIRPYSLCRGNDHTFRIFWKLVQNILMVSWVDNNHNKNMGLPTDGRFNCRTRSTANAMVQSNQSYLWKSLMKILKVNDILNSENLKSLFSSFLFIFGHFSEYIKFRKTKIFFTELFSSFLLMFRTFWINFQCK